MTLIQLLILFWKMLWFSSSKRATVRLFNTINDIIEGRATIANVDLDFKAAFIKARSDTITFYDSSLLSNKMNFGTLHSTLSINNINEMIKNIPHKNE